MFKNKGFGLFYFIILILFIYRLGLSEVTRVELVFYVSIVFFVFRKKFFKK